MKMKNIMEILKNNKKKVIAISVGTILVASLGFYKFGYLNNGIGMSDKTKEEKINQLINDKKYVKAKEINEIYFNNSDKSFIGRIQRCEETGTRNIKDANAIYSQIEIQPEANIYIPKKVTIYNLNEFLNNNMEVKVSTLLTNPTDFSGEIKVKFIYEDLNKNVIDEQTQIYTFEPNSTKKLVQDINKNKVNPFKTNCYCELEDIHLSRI